jgi:hypothetical protein
LTDATPVRSAPLQYNLLKLYRQHRDEIDTLSDPTTLFILDFTSHYGIVQLDELAGDLGLSPTALKKKITPLLRGQMVAENSEAVTVTTLGKRLLDHIEFLPPLAVSPEVANLERKISNSTPATPPLVKTPSTPGWLWGLIAFLGIAAVALIILLIIELGFLIQQASLPLILH